MNKLEKSQKELFAISKKYSEIRKQNNVSDIELQKVRDEFNQAVSNWCKLEEYCFKLNTDDYLDAKPIDNYLKAKGIDFKRTKPRKPDPLIKTINFSLLFILTTILISILTN